jgi:hypothetical protein
VDLGEMIARTGSNRAETKFIKILNFLSKAYKTRYGDIQKYWFSLRQEHKWKKLLNGELVILFFDLFSQKALHTTSATGKKKLH